MCTATALTDLSQKKGGRDNVMASSSGGQQAHSGSAAPGGDADASPLVPLEYADAPNQRFYAVSVAIEEQ